MWPFTDCANLLQNAPEFRGYKFNSIGPSTRCTSLPQYKVHVIVYASSVIISLTSATASPLHVVSGGCCNARWIFFFLISFSSVVV